MPLSVATEHIQFFNQNSRIEFENLLNLNQLKTLSICVRDIAAKKSHALSLGFDLWRREPSLKPIICSSNLAKIAGQLKNLHELRYAYSQYLSSNCYDNEATFLYRKSFIKELVCGVCLCLKPSSEPESPFFSHEARSALFFDIDPDFHLRFPKTRGEYLFIFFAEYKARFYLQNEENPHQTLFRKLGYHHGEFLMDKHNPSFRQILL